jgi:hypothetical protein
VIFDTYTDPYGNPKFYEYFDTRTGARRIAYGSYWDGRNRSKSMGIAVQGVDDFAEVLEYNLEAYQMTWTRGERNPKLIRFGLAFPWLFPEIGDQLIDEDSKELFTVTHVPRSPEGYPWNLTVLLDREPTNGAFLRWIGEARDRNLVDFHAENGKPGTPTPGEDTTGDTGIAYSKVLRPTITYLLVRQEAYTISGPPFGSSKELKPRVREQFNDPHSPQRVITILGQRMDNLVKFLCIHPRAETANGLARWFKDGISRRTPSLEANGINRILFWSQSTRERKGKPGDDAAVTEVVYYVVTEELSVQEDSAIKKYNLTNRVLHGDINSLGLTGITEPGDDGYLYPYTGAYDESGNNLWWDLESQDYGYTGTT